MVGVSKTFTNQKRVLNNIYLSFFYGAKIGIIGLNGSGKSTLMKIIAGIDKNFDGEVVFSPGYTVGYLEQEPRLDDSKTVREVVEEGCATTVALLKEYEEINQKLCEPMDDDTMARLIERQGELYEKIDQCNGMAYPQAEIAVMGAAGAVNILYRKSTPEEKQEIIKDYEDKFSNPYCAAERGLIDEVIMPRDTRYKLIQALEMCHNKNQSNPPKKHGNMPL